MKLFCLAKKACVCPWRASAPMESWYNSCILCVTDTKDMLYCQCAVIFFYYQSVKFYWNPRVWDDWSSWYIILGFFCYQQCNICVNIGKENVLCVWEREREEREMLFHLIWMHRKEKLFLSVILYTFMHIRNKRYTMCLYVCIWCADLPFCNSA